MTKLVEAISKATARVKSTPLRNNDGADQCDRVIRTRTRRRRPDHAAGLITQPAAEARVVV